MASFKDLEDEWNMCIKDDLSLCTENDLQLAAELGKNLLERNKELENALKHTQSVVDDQLQEIEYLTKQSVALREVNDSRLRIYEQLEVSIHDLERANHRLLLENAAEKKHVKSLASTIENLEAKNEELLTTIDDLRLQTDILKKKLRRSSELTTPVQSPAGVVVLRRVVDQQPLSSNYAEASMILHEEVKTEDGGKEEEKKLSNVESLLAEVNNDDDDCQNTDNIEDVAKMLSQLREFKTQCAKEQRKVMELEEQLSTVVQQNQALENQIIKLHHKDEDVKSVHEEFSLLEEVRQGQTCSRCLRNMESPERRRTETEKTYESPPNLPEDDDSSILDELMTASPPYVSAYALNVQDYPKTPQNTTNKPKNHYKEFVEKYEALFEDHPNQDTRKHQRKEQFVSLQEELRNSGEYGVFERREHDDEDATSDKQNKKIGKAVSHTPTDFSEAETSSSGFADETSTKSTQTEGIVGSLLCAIQDGDDCKFSIYDEISPIDSRFRKRPEYRELFKEIFEVLKKAADNKDEGLEAIQGLESNNSSLCTAPSEAPINESITDFPDDDTESLQSSNVSFPASFSQQSSFIEDVDKGELINQTPTEEPSKVEEPVLRPLIRQSFDYLHVERRKRSGSRRRKNRNAADRSDSPITHIIGSPKISYSNRPASGRRRRELRALEKAGVEIQPAAPTSCDAVPWNGNTMQFWASNIRASSPTPSQSSEKTTLEFKPSVASQEIKKLKSLDKSYAEVLKLGEGRSKREHQRFGRGCGKGTSLHR